MILELPRTGLDAIRPLFEPLRFHLCSAAVLDGNNPGRVFVDDPEAPRTAFMFAPEGSYLVGRATNERFSRALNAMIFEQGAFGREGCLAFACHPADWQEQLGTICHPREPILQPRCHHVCRRIARDWRPSLPNDFEVRTLDQDLLDQPGLDIPQHIHDWIVGNWGSNDTFFRKGFGCVTLQEDRLVSWSVADGVSGDACEIGIRTSPGYRRRGLAAVTAAAAVEIALSRGYAQVGWHHAEENIGSRRTAERVGFELERRYTMYDIMLDEADHLLETGWDRFKAGLFDDAIGCYEEALGQRPDLDPYLDHVVARAHAALGRERQAQRHLEKAIERGWSGAKHTEECVEFDAMRSRPDWPALIARIRANEAPGNSDG